MIASRAAPPCFVLACALAIGSTLFFPPPARRETKPRGGMPSARSEARVHQVSDLEACFVEWSERESGDATIQVRVALGADDVVKDPVVAVDGSDRVTDSLARCATAALRHADYGTPDEERDLEITLTWRAGVLTISPRPSPRAYMTTDEARHRLADLRRKIAELERQRRKLIRRAARRGYSH